MREANLPQITTAMLNNLKARLKCKKIGKSQSNLTEIIKWSATPTDLDQVFCGGIDYEIDDNEELQRLRVVVTTLRLIEIMKFNCKIYKICLCFILNNLVFIYLAKILATDGTYKLNHNGFPILMTGTVDMNR